MKFNDYQTSTAKTAKSYKGRVLSIEDFSGILAVLEAGSATTKIAGALKKKVFHGHDKFIDVRNYQAMRKYVNEITDVPQYKPANSPFLDEETQKYIDTVMGIIDESGEVGEALVKYLNGDFKNKEEFKKKLEDELGDVLWYIASASAAAGIPLSNVAAANVAKLQARYPEGFTCNASQNRDLKAEAAAQEATWGTIEDPKKSENEIMKMQIEALKKAKRAFEATLVNASGKVAIEGSTEDVKTLQQAYDEIIKVLGVGNNE